MQKEKSCGCVILNKSKVLLVQQVEGHWGFPKGHIEQGETEEETAIREVKEEVNIDVEIDSNYRYEEEYIINEEIDKKVVYFVAKVVDGEIKRQESEIKQIKWVNFDEAFNLITYESAKNILTKVIEDLRITENI